MIHEDGLEMKFLDEAAKSITQSTRQGTNRELRRHWTTSGGSASEVCPIDAGVDLEKRLVLIAVDKICLERFGDFGIAVSTKPFITIRSKLLAPNRPKLLAQEFQR